MTSLTRADAYLLASRSRVAGGSSARRRGSELSATSAALTVRPSRFRQIPSTASVWLSPARFVADPTPSITGRGSPAASMSGAVSLVSSGTSWSQAAAGQPAVRDDAYRVRAGHREYQSA